MSENIWLGTYQLYPATILAINELCHFFEQRKITNPLISLFKGMIKFSKNRISLKKTDIPHMQL